jgi:hypothetical protein
VVPPRQLRRSLSTFFDCCVGKDTYAMAMATPRQPLLLPGCQDRSFGRPSCLCSEMGILARFPSFAVAAVGRTPAALLTWHGWQAAGRLLTTTEGEHPTFGRLLVDLGFKVPRRRLLTRIALPHSRTSRVVCLRTGTVRATDQKLGVRAAGTVTPEGAT